MCMCRPAGSQLVSPVKVMTEKNRTTLGQREATACTHATVMVLSTIKDFAHTRDLFGVFSKTISHQRQIFAAQKATFIFSSLVRIFQLVAAPAALHRPQTSLTNHRATVQCV